MKAITAPLTGHTVTATGRHLRFDHAQLEDLPTTATGAPPVHLSVDVANRALLDLAARRADVWAVQRREDGQLLGTLLLKAIPASSDQTPLPPSGDIEIGWHLHPDAWGHGYASEATARVLAHAFASGLLEVVAVTYPANTASQAVARRIGMTHQGQTTRYYNATCELFTASTSTG